MKVTFFIGSLYGGGAERVTCNLASFLTYKGYDAEILTISETEQSYELDKKVTVNTLLPLIERKGKIRNIIVRLPRFWHYLKTNETDVYVVMLPKTIIMLLVFRWMTKAKIIAAERNNPEAYGKFLAKILRKYASRAEGWVFQTEDAKNWYETSIDNSKSIVIPNAINPLFIRPRYKGEKRKNIVGVGRLNSQKNFNLLIKAFSNVASEFPNYDLIIYGKGDKESELMDLISELGLEDRVKLPGNIQNIADEIEKSTLFVLSSDFEGMPNALMEAMALGLPCISTDCPCGGPRFLIQDEVNGLLVPIGDVTAMTDAIRKILNDPKKAEIIGENARKITKRLEPNKIYGQWEKFINSFIVEREDN